MGSAFYSKVGSRSIRLAVGRLMKNLQSVHLLIVDRESLVLSAVEMALEAKGMKASCFGSVAEALEAMNGKGEIFDVAMIDVELDREDQFELCRSLGKSRKEGGIPVILTTTHPSPEGRMESLALGAVLYLAKPFGLDVLDRSISEALSGSRVSG